MIPLYGFLEGDTLGLLVLAEPEETVSELARKLETAAGLRVAPRRSLRVLFRGQAMNPRLTVALAGMTALDRFDVVMQEQEAAP